MIPLLPSQGTEGKFALPALPPVGDMASRRELDTQPKLVTPGP